MPTKIMHINRFQRQENGNWRHPQLPAHTSPAEFDNWLEENELDIRRVYMCDDPTAKTLWANYLMPDESVSRAAYLAWNPNGGGDGWFLLALEEQEDGPVAFFAREITPDLPVEQTLEESMGLPPLPESDFESGIMEERTYSETRMLAYGKLAREMGESEQMAALKEELAVRKSQIINLQSAITVLVPLDEDLASEKYYIAAFNHLPVNDQMLWLCAENRGYTPDLNVAGLFDFEEAQALCDGSRGEMVPVPVPFIKTLRVRRVVNVTDTLNARYGDAQVLRSEVIHYNAMRHGHAVE